MSEWISVKDRLPEKGQTVIILEDGGSKNVAQYYRDYRNIFSISVSVVDAYASVSIRIEDVTHWMPLPEPPKE